MPTPTIGLVAPASKSWLGVARELLMGTAVLPVQTIPLLKNSFQPEDTPKWLHDEAIRGSMALVFNDIQGVEDATFSYGGPAFLDVEGYFLDNLFGDKSDTATTTGTTTTLTAQGTIGATSLSVSGTAGFTAGQYAVVGTGSTSEIVGTIGLAASTINFSPTPLRFTHANGSTIAAVNAATGGPFCVDESTEILTADGWKTWKHLHPGDSVLTYNHGTGTAEWQDVQEVCVFPAGPREMVSMEGRGHSSLTTPNHRWPVVTRSGYRRWRTTETIALADRIPVGAFCSDLPDEAKYTDAFVELVAWFFTEGTIRENSTAVRICQSHKNAENIARIDAALRVFGPPADTLGQGSPVPRWRRRTETRAGAAPVERFSLNAAAGKFLLDVAPGKVVSREFLRSLTQAQLDLFIKASMLADNAGPTRLSQANRERAEAFQFAAVLAGYPTSLLERRVGGTGPYAGTPMWQVTLQRRRFVTPAMAAYETKRLGSNGWKNERVTYDGVVWCPRTPNQTWYARRNGTCYFTGNTHTWNIYNASSGQPPTHTFTDYTSLTSTVGARAYVGACVGVIDITGNSEQLLEFKMTGSSWVSAPAASTPTNTVSTVIPVPNWRSTVSVGGTEIFDVGEWSVSLKRTLQVYWTDQGTTQNPYIIARGPLDATGMLNYTVPTDESPLTQMLNNTQPNLSINIGNGVSGAGTLGMTIAATVCAFEKAKPERSQVLIGYQDDWQAVANSSNSGGSGGLGPITVVLNNNVPTY